MSVFFTSDPHIGHAKVAKIRATNAMVALEDVFDDKYAIEWHDRWLALRWDETVGKDDQIWVLGDISGGGSKAQRNALAWIAERPGEKHLIAGNHDGCSPLHRDSHKWQREYLEVFNSVQPFARRKISLPNDVSQQVMLSHFPYEGEGARPGGDRFTQYRLRDEGLTLLHGHVHDKERVTDTETGTRQIHVGPDAWDFAPVHLDEIVAIIGEEVKVEA